MKPNQSQNITISNTSTASPNSSKSHQSPAFIVIAVICTILACAGITFGIYGLLDANNKATENANLRAKIDLLQIETGAELIESTKDGVTTTTVATKDDSDLFIKTLASQVEVALTEKFQNGNFFTTFGDGSIIKLAGTNIYTSSNKSYGVVSSSFTDEPGIQYWILEDAQSVIEPILTSNGFVLTDYDYLGKNLYYNANKDVYCRASISVPLNFSCSSGNWITEEQAAFVTDLARIANVNSISASPSNIQDSSVSPYQTLEARGAGYTALFYRTSPSSEWQFFTGTQAILDCEDFSTEDLKNAFAGTICWDTTTSQQSTVQP